MKPLKLSIHTSIPLQDGYLYAGNLFLVFKDGTLKTLPITRVLQKYFGEDVENFNFFNLAFSRNSWYTNEQADTLFAIENIKKTFTDNWEKYNGGNLEIEFSEDEFDSYLKLPKLPIFDFRLYGMRMFVGNRDGLFDTGIDIDPKNAKVSFKDSLERVFDARTTYLSAKSDSLLVTSNSDGLFHGRLVQTNGRLVVTESPIRKESLRTGWNGYNVVNYSTQNNFDLLLTEREQVKERTFLYSAADEDSKKIKITGIGEESFNMDEVLSLHSDLIDNIKYVFNAPKSCYFFLKNGEFINIFFNKYQNRNLLSRKIYDTWKPDSANTRNSKIISANAIKDGCVVEYDDSVILIKGHQEIPLKTNPVLSVRTYATSIRYKNIISIVDRNGIDLYSVFPF